MITTQNYCSELRCSMTYINPNMTLISLVTDLNTVSIHTDQDDLIATSLAVSFRSIKLQKQK